MVLAFLLKHKLNFSACLSKLWVIITVKRIVPYWPAVTILPQTHYLKEGWIHLSGFWKLLENYLTVPSWNVCIYLAASHVTWPSCNSDYLFYFVRRSVNDELLKQPTMHRIDSSLMHILILKGKSKKEVLQTNICALSKFTHRVLTHWVILEEDLSEW